MADALQPDDDASNPSGGESSGGANTDKEAEKLLNRINARYKALHGDWFPQIREAEKIYTGETGLDDPFNILFSNTETLQAALYSQAPKPEVRRRWTATDEKAQRLDAAAASVLQRSLTYLTDTNDLSEESFTEAAAANVHDALIAGQGVSRVIYYGPDPTSDDSGASHQQRICFRSYDWDRFLWGKSRSWASCPWIAFGTDLNKADFERYYPQFCKTPAYLDFDWDNSNTRESEKANEDKSDSSPQPIKGSLLIWEYFDPIKRTITHICDKFRDAPTPLLVEPYPTELNARFPTPKPLTWMHKARSTTPIPPYVTYKQLAEQLNIITSRLRRVTDAIRVRGVYNGQIKDIERLLGEDKDNGLIASEATLALIQSGGMEKHIWLLPIDVFIKVAKELTLVQANIKQTIFEVMGMADVQRGASVASETATAQSIKDRWGGLRLKTRQVEVARYCRDLLRIATDFMSGLFTPASFQQITQLPYPFAAAKAAAQQQYQAMMAQYQSNADEAAAMMQAEGGGPPPPEMQPPPPPPMLAEPSWEEIIERLRNNIQRTHIVDIEVNSTLDIDATEEKQDVAEFMTAFQPLIQGLGTAVEAQIIPPASAKVIMLEVTKRFRLGRAIEEELLKIQPPGQSQGEGTDAMQAAHDSELAAADSKAQAAQDRLRVEAEKSAVVYEKRIAVLEIENKRLKAGSQLESQQHQLETSAQTQQHQLETQHRDAQDALEDQATGIEQSRQGFAHEQALAAQAQKTSAAQQQVRDTAQQGKMNMAAERIRQRKASAKKPNKAKGA